MRIGNNRLTWGKDGSLFVGRTKLSWAGDSGITKVTWDGKVDFDIETIKLTPRGFKITFTKSLAQPNLEHLAISSYHYRYHETYGSPRTDEKTLAVESFNLSKNGKTLDLELSEMTAGKVYDFTFNGFKSKKKEPLKSTRLCYTLNRLK